VTVCTWTPSCKRPGTHELECQTRPGLIILVTACEQHLAVAEMRGYRVRHNGDARINGHPRRSGERQDDQRGVGR